MHRIVTYLMLVYFTYLLYYLPPAEKKLEICCQMNKEIFFYINQYLRTTLHRKMAYSMLIYFIYVLCYLPGREKTQNFKVLLQEKEYN